MQVTVQVNKELAIRARRDLPSGYHKKTHIKCKTVLSEEDLERLEPSVLDALVEYHINTVREIEKARFPELSSNDKEEFLDALKTWTVNVEEARAKKAEFLLKAERWVAEHGSVRLKRIVEEGLLDSSLSQYRKERVEHLASAWMWVADVKNAQQDKRVLNPSEEAFALLDVARKDLPEAKLVSWRIETPDSDKAFERRWACRSKFLDGEVVLLGEPQ